MLRPARSTGNLIDISSPPSSNDDRDDIKILNRRHNSPSIGSEKPKIDSMDHNLAGSRKFYPSNRSSKSYTSTVSSKIKKQNLHTNNNNVNALGSNINASNLIAITRFVNIFHIPNLNSIQKMSFFFIAKFDFNLIISEMG